MPILGNILFWMHIEMNEMVNKFLLAGDKFMPEMHLRQPGFTYSAWGRFTKNKERIQKFKEIGDRSYIDKNELECFQYDMAYVDFKDLAEGTIADKVLWDIDHIFSKIWWISKRIGFNGIKMFW